MTGPESTFEALPKAYKGIFPFRICAPSYIYPATWVDNIRLLGPALDEIEILLFDSARDSDYPSKRDIDTMAKMSQRFNVTYNIHLPIDLFPGSANDDLRQHAVDTLIRTYRLMAPLHPTAAILHLPVNFPDADNTARQHWRQRVARSVEALISSGIPGKMLCVETLDYPLAWVAPVIHQFGLRICLDLGHLLDQSVDWLAVYRNWSRRINMVHLHGIKNGRDHRSLTHLPRPLVKQILNQLHTFTGTLSIEVFAYAQLKDSLAYLAQCWRDC